MHRTTALIFAVVLVTGCSSSRPTARAPFAPPSIPVVPVEVCWVETGGAQVPGWLGASGPVSAPVWDITASTLVIRHPKGDWLVDAGISPWAAKESESLPPYRRFIFNQTAARDVLRARLDDQLKVLGISKPVGVILSHSHADHAGGLVTLAESPVWAAAPEVEMIERERRTPRGLVMPAHAAAMAGRLNVIPFRNVEYETYDAQWDVFGDGSVVVVPAFGHTPGSVLTFVTLGDGRRLVHVGDLINLNEGLEHGDGKSWPMRAVTDMNESATADEVKKLARLHQLDPQLLVLPAHDRPVWQELFRGDAASVPCTGRGQ